MTGHSLAVRDLAVRYGKAVAVDGLSFTARGGEVTALVGPNGAGKSSTVLGVYGSTPASGTVVVDGQDVSSMTPLQRARHGVALVPQGRQLFPRMTVVENLQLMAEMLHLKRDSVDGALDRFPILRQRSGALAGVLSGGEQQMLVVTRALMTTPRVLLLDEMMTGLAPRIVRGLAQNVADLAAEGVAVVIADPSIGPLRRIIDRGYVLVRGRVVAEAGSPTELERRYQQAMGVITQEVQAEAESTADGLHPDGLRDPEPADGPIREGER